MAARWFRTRGASGALPTSEAIRPRRARRGALAAAALLVLSGCSADGLAFRRDDRVRILSPARRSTVRLPIVIRWRGEEGEQGRRFGVFVDQAPMAAGKDLRSVARRDKECRSQPGCPDERWFRVRNIYATTATSLRLETLPDTRPRERKDVKERHEVVVVLLDRANRRIGESGHTVEFFVTREPRRRG